MISEKLFVHSCEVINNARIREDKINDFFGSICEEFLYTTSMDPQVTFVEVLNLHFPTQVSQYAKHNHDWTSPIESYLFEYNAEPGSSIRFYHKDGSFHIVHIQSFSELYANLASCEKE